MKLKAALPALAVAAVGVPLAWVALEVDWKAAVALAAFDLLVAQAFYATGKSRPKTDPVGALPMLELRVLRDAGLAAGASAGVIAIAVATEPKKAWTLDEKKLYAAAAGAATSFLTAAFIKSAETADESWIGDHVKQDFAAAFTTTLAERTPRSRRAFQEDQLGAARRAGSALRSSRKSSHPAANSRTAVA